MYTALRQSFGLRSLLCLWAALGLAGSQLCRPARCRATDAPRAKQEMQSMRKDTAEDSTKSPPNLQTSQEWNRRLREVLDANSAAPNPGPQDYRIGFDDVLDISVFE